MSKLFWQKDSLVTLILFDPCLLNISDCHKIFVISQLSKNRTTHYSGIFTKNEYPIFFTILFQLILKWVKESTQCTARIIIPHLGIGILVS